MAGYWPQSNTQIHDANGRPLIGAKAYFFAAATSTPIATYRSYSLGSVNQHPNPVQTDGAGFFPSVFLDEADEFYRVRITTQAGVIIYDVDGIPIIGPNSEGGGGSETPVNPDAVLTTGDMLFRYGTGLRSGFVRANGRTIGSAVSGASERANADAQALYEHLWAADETLVVVGDRGASASADWAANKPLTLPDFRGSAPIGMDTMGNSAAGVVSAATALGWKGGTQTHTLTVNEMPSHNHGGTTSHVADHSHGYLLPVLAGGSGVPSGGGVNLGNTGADTAGAGAHSHTISSQGGGAAHNNMQPSVAGTFYIRL